MIMIVVTMLSTLLLTYLVMHLLLLLIAGGAILMGQRVAGRTMLLGWMLSPLGWFVAGRWALRTPADIDAWVDWVMGDDA